MYPEPTEAPLQAWDLLREKREDNLRMSICRHVLYPFGTAEHVCRDQDCRNTYPFVLSPGCQEERIAQVCLVSLTPGLLGCTCYYVSPMPAKLGAPVQAEDLDSVAGPENLVPSSGHRSPVQNQTQHPEKTARYQRWG